MNYFSIEVDADGVALVTLDVAGKAMNVINDEVQEELGRVIETIRTTPGVRGAVLCSGKVSGFCAGADLGEIIGHFPRWRAAASQDELRQGLAESGSLSRHLRALETCGKPVAAAIGGMALGGGLELALACHFRVAVDDPKLRLALPEVSVGLLPGGGGTQRLIRLVGIEAALPYLLDGAPITPADALSSGIVHALVPAGAVVETARRWVLEHPDAVAPWDEKTFKLPGGGPHAPAGYRVFAPAMAARLAAGNADHPAVANILKCVYEGSQVPIDAGLRIESRYFFNTVRSPRAEAMARTFFVSRQVLAKRTQREDTSAYLGELRRMVEHEIQEMLDEGVVPELVRNLARQSALGIEALESRKGERKSVVESDFDDIAALRQRLLYVQAVAAARCLDRRLIGDVLEADAAAVAAGFPGWTGGPISFIETEGLERFVERVDALAEQHGERFVIPSGLRERAAAGRSYYR